MEDSSAPGPAGAVASIPLPEESRRPRSAQPREPARPPPPPEPETEPSVRLPPKWRMATDDTGKVYYYHQVGGVSVSLSPLWLPGLGCRCGSSIVGHEWFCKLILYVIWLCCRFVPTFLLIHIVAYPVIVIRVLLLCDIISWSSGEDFVTKRPVVFTGRRLL